VIDPQTQSTQINTNNTKTLSQTPNKSNEVSITVPLSQPVPHSNQIRTISYKAPSTFQHQVQTLISNTISIDLINDDMIDDPPTAIDLTDDITDEHPISQSDYVLGSFPYPSRSSIDVRVSDLQRLNSAMSYLNDTIMDCWRE